MSFLRGREEDWLGSGADGLGGELKSLLGAGGGTAGVILTSSHEPTKGRDM